MLRDSKGRLWAGSYEGLVEIIQLPGQRESRPKLVFKTYRHDPENPYSLSHPQIRSIYEDRGGAIWVGTFRGGLNRFDPTTGRFIRYQNEMHNPRSISFNDVRDMLDDRHGNFWVVTWGGGLNKMDRSTGDFIHYRPDPQNPHSLRDQNVTSIMEDSRKRLWIGTAGSGFALFDPIAETFQHFTTQEGLPNDVVYGILEDSHGFLWMSTNNGICRFNPETNEFRCYDLADGLQSAEFNNGAYYKNEKGWFFFGGINGFNCFHPDTIRENQNIPPVALTEFRLFNEPVFPSANGTLLTRTIDYTSILKLSYQEYVIAFSFAALDYVSPAKNRYAYKLEGFDKEWNYTDAQRRYATYTNLPAGVYTFRVKASNNDQIWNQSGTALSIIITPPPWKTWWAYTSYVISLLGAALLFIRSQKRKVALKQKELEREKEVTKRLKQLDQMKDEFLANTSHELRTPLNGIIGIAESLMEGVAGELNNLTRKNLAMVVSSARRLAGLVNDILDFSKLKNRGMILKLRPIDLHSLAEVILNLSKPLAGKKEIEFINQISHDFPPVEADEERLQQILFNLIGNAIKFTDSGRVTISAETEGQRALIHISDTGIGIAPDKFQRIFLSFEQAEGDTTRLYGGTGLGLTITKQLVELHKGEIRVESELNRGSTFTFTLSLSAEPLDSLSVRYETVNLLPEPILESLTALPNQNPASAIKKADFNVLIVDDEAVNRQVLLNFLSMQNYNIYEAVNGQEALDYLESDTRFDLILLDIMMPKISGFEVTQKIRKKHSMYELPIIFLTAKNQVSDIVEGFSLGANDFISKPISKNELVSRVKTHLELLDINRNLELKVEQRTLALNERNQELETLNSIIRLINQEIEYPNVIRALVDKGLIIFPQAQRCIFLQREQLEDRFRIFDSAGLDIADHNPYNLSYDEIIQVYAAESMQVDEGVFVVHSLTALNAHWRETKLPGPQSVLYMTIEIDQNLTGFLIFENFQKRELFNQSDFAMLKRFRGHAISAVGKALLLEKQRHLNNELTQANRKLEEISLTDPLTGLRNRRYLQQTIDKEIARVLRDYAQHTGQESSVAHTGLLFLMIDLDFFKRINDTYGHLAGDQVLIQLSNILTSLCRESDTIVRWGGEEFLVTTHPSTLSQSAAFAERIRSTVSAHPFELPDGEILKQTCSIGYAIFPFFPANLTLMNWEQVVNIADEALYIAKNSGRDTWVGVIPTGHSIHPVIATQHDLQTLREHQLVELQTRKMNSDPAD